MEVKKTTVEKVRELAQPIADELGFFLWDVRFEKEGATWYLRVLIDKDGGIDMDDCEAFTRPMNKVLDEADHRNDIIQKRLRTVESLESTEASSILEIE